MLWQNPATHIYMTLQCLETGDGWRSSKMLRHPSLFDIILISVAHHSFVSYEHPQLLVISCSFQCLSWLVVADLVIETTAYCMHILVRAMIRVLTHIFIWYTVHINELQIGWIWSQTHIFFIMTYSCTSVMSFNIRSLKCLYFNVEGWCV